jgi:osmotically-inducible protein OsmY
LSITVREGQVTLRGVALNQDAKDAAMARASAVAGAANVRNEIVVAP